MVTCQLKIITRIKISSLRQIIVFDNIKRINRQMRRTRYFLFKMIEKANREVP